MSKRNQIKGKYYWKFKAIIPEVLSEQKQCLICGSQTNLNIHHLVHCNSFEKKYSDKNNLIVLCRDCHREYHNTFNKSTPVTLLEYINLKHYKRIQEYISEIDYLKREMREYQNMINYILQMR